MLRARITGLSVSACMPSFLWADDAACAWRGVRVQRLCSDLHSGRIFHCLDDVQGGHLIHIKAIPWKSKACRRCSKLGDLKGC